MYKVAYTLRVPGSQQCVGVCICSNRPGQAWTVTRHSDGQVIGTGDHKWAAIDAAILTLKTAAR
jgi:hypothetical protein